MCLVVVLAFVGYCREVFSLMIQQHFQGGLQPDYFTQLLWADANLSDKISFQLPSFG